MKLEDMTTKELKELKIDKIRNFYDLIELCKQVGNKDYMNNVLVKGVQKKIAEIDKILIERGEQ